MRDTTLEKTACRLPAVSRHLLETCEELIEQSCPNLFRLYLNPHVAQACYLLAHCVSRLTPQSRRHGDYPAFLANSGEEALSGAIKLARYAACQQGHSTRGVLYDPDRRWEHFAGTTLLNGDSLQFVPGVSVPRDPYELACVLTEQDHSPEWLVVPHELLVSGELPGVASLLEGASSTGRPLLITTVSSEDFAERRVGHDLTPDCVIFDEQFVDHDLAFGAFAARGSLYSLWRQKRMSTFHSTTFQPNSLTTRHLVKCLQQNFPGFFFDCAPRLSAISNDQHLRRDVLSKLFSPQLVKLTQITGFDHSELRADGHYVEAGPKRVFDGVAGVACSIRGHNPPALVDELRESAEGDSATNIVTHELRRLTGLSNWIPAVSGASAVEQALKLALAAQTPRAHILVLRGGFGGKTLFALTGTWKPALREGLGPLYPHVVYVDPFASDAVEQVETAFRDYPIGVIQAELIQGVGGVRPLPDEVVECLKRFRAEEDCLLFVDEIQTGMYRTGPFVRSRGVGVQADLLTLGKATSDMMFPSGLTLYSDAVAARLSDRGCRIPEIARRRHSFAASIHTVANTLVRSDHEGLSDLVTHAGERFKARLSEELKDCRLVRDIRCFGLLIGIELQASGWSSRLLKKLLYQLYLLALINHRPFPLLVGFCQYEPNVLKLTPPLSITDAEIDQVCRTLGTVLRTPLPRVAASGLLRVLGNR